MTEHQLFQWAKIRNFPQLVIRSNPREIIRAGAVSWWLFTLLANDEQLARAEDRVRMWDRYEQEVMAR